MGCANLIHILGALAFAVVLPCISASAFLHSKTPEQMHQIAREIIESTLLSELSFDSTRLKKFEEDLRPMYLAMPKNEHGTMDPAAVRYVLHRYFVQKHGWYVKGLEPAGQSWNSSSPSSILTSRVPAFVESLFEQRLHGEGMGLHDVAVFAATLSDFVHNEALSDVMDLFAAFRLSTTELVRALDADRVIKGYMLQILDGYTSIKSMNDMRELEIGMREDFPAWDDLKMWVHDTRLTSKAERAARSFSVETEEVSFQLVVEQVQELNDHLGAFQDIECRSLKAGLTEMEYRSTGRVLLSDFYRAGLDGKFLFIEHVDYLRKLGVLDESDPKHPSVIIANYLAGPANCLTSTSFHSVCCFDECEGLMSHLENVIAAPVASAGCIAELVTQLRSDTVDAPRNLSASVLSRLDEIAEHHDGVVPLHGRLFAQWMHHVYPLECPYPHAAGTTQPLTPDEWMDESGRDEVAASRHERATHIERARQIKEEPSPEFSTELPWLASEELVVSRSIPQSSSRSLFRKFMALAAIIALLVPATKASAAFLLPCQSKTDKCHMV